MKAEIGTPWGLAQSGSMDGHCSIGAVNREFGCAALRPQSGVQSLPRQQMAWLGGGPSIPSHQTSPSSVNATLVKMTFFASIFIALGFDFIEVPGATPKAPFSGLIARSRPSLSGLIHA